MTKSWGRAILLIQPTCSKLNWPNMVCGGVLSGSIRGLLLSRKCSFSSLLERMLVDIIFINL